MKKIFTLLLGILLGLLVLQADGRAKIASKVVEETIEAAAKRSGRALSKTAEKKLGVELLEMAGKYGDDVMPLVREGGLEVLEQGAKHGDDFWRLCKQVPGASRAMALHADDLIPLAKRIGPEVLEIEARTPGMAARIAGEFGDDAVKVLAKHNPQDTTRLLGYAAKADSPETSRLLYETYTKSSNPGAFLDHLNWKHIMAGGLSAAAILAAYKTSDGLQEGLKNPEVAKEVSQSVTRPVSYFLYGLASLVLLFLGFKGILLSIKTWKHHKLSLENMKNASAQTSTEKSHISK